MRPASPCYDTGQAPARPYAAFAGRPARGVRRGGAGTGLPRPHPPAAAADPATSLRGRPRARRSRRHRLYPGTRDWPGALLVGASVAQRAWRFALAFRSIGMHHLEGHLLSPLLAARRRRVSRSWRCWFPAAIPSSCASTASARYRLAGRDRGRRRRRGLRQDRKAAGPALSRRAGARSLPNPAIRALQVAAADDRERRSRFQLLRAEDRGADARLRQAPNAKASADIAAHSRTPSSMCWSRNAARAIARTGLTQLVVAGGVGANRAVARSASCAARAAGDSRCSIRRWTCAPTTAR